MQNSFESLQCNIVQQCNMQNIIIRLKLHNVILQLECSKHWQSERMRYYCGFSRVKHIVGNSISCSVIACILHIQSNLVGDIVGQCVLMRCSILPTSRWHQSSKSSTLTNKETPPGAKADALREEMEEAANRMEICRVGGASPSLYYSMRTHIVNMQHHVSCRCFSGSALGGHVQFRGQRNRLCKLLPDGECFTRSDEQRASLSLTSSVAVCS